MRELAKEIARDGEGATKLVEVIVEGAGDEASAATLAKAVAGSNLCKAAVYGEDANWGRVLNAMGYSGVPFAQKAWIYTSVPSRSLRRGSPYRTIRRRQTRRSPETRSSSPLGSGKERPRRPRGAAI
jgi:N-acetylglutamate synthase/N-acetylornithine aminotransferase